MMSQEMQRLSDNDANDAKAATATVSSDNMSDHESKGILSTWHRRLFGMWQLSLTAKNIDRVSRRIFPAVFVIFNIVYWTYYLTGPHYHCNISKMIEMDDCINETTSQATSSGFH